jgi:hypothetical protein
MKLLSTSLALFLGAVLATITDAAPGGLKKNDESASLHRSLQLDDSEAAAAAECMCIRSRATLENYVLHLKFFLCSPLPTSFLQVLLEDLPTNPTI